MKLHWNKPAILVLALVLFSADAFSQFEITPYTGYMFGGRSRGYYFEANIADGSNFGIIGDINIYSGVQIELMYTRLVSATTLWDYRENESEIIDLASEYFLVGGLYELEYGRFKPFGVVLGGVAVHSPQDPGYTNKVSFAMGLGGGLKVMLTDFLGIRGQGRLLTPLYVSGLGLGCGIGTGGVNCGSGVRLSSTLLQGDFSVGIILVIGGNKASSY